MLRFSTISNQIKIQTRYFIAGLTKKNSEKIIVQESDRLKQFHEQLKLEGTPNLKERERFVDLVLVETDPITGEVIPDSEKNPTKWGDWQHGGRVSDF